MTQSNAQRIATTIERNSGNATALHNLTHLQRFVAQQRDAANTGPACPTCGQSTNPTILAAYGQCQRCEFATAKD